MACRWGYPQEVSGSPNTVSIVSEQSMVEPPSDPSAEGGESHVHVVDASPEDDPAQ